MNILPVNYQQNLQSFKGLWGRVSSEGSASEVSSHVLEVFTYHPFTDEPNSSINYNLRSKRTSWTDEAAGFTSSYDSYAYLGKCLPFTEKEYDAYKALKGKKLDANGIAVEDGLANAKLYGYMNSRIKYYARKIAQLLHKHIKK